ncbi:MAG: GNAT family N-acetyltransferase [Gammaproteobacteria bacterium]|nr:GNAT family N-acetyltransferase [Gammaproteobacteria bacterium]
MATLATDRLNIRPFEMEDAQALHAFWSNVDVRRYLWDGIILPIDTVRGIIRQSIADFEAHGFGFFSLDLKVTEPKIVGFCGFRRFEDGEQIELLFGILPEYWGEGFVTEAAREVLRYGFEEAGITRIIAAADTPNQRSVRLLMRLGMSFEARREWHGLDTVFYTLTATEFREQ